MVTRIYKTQSEIAPPKKKSLAAKTSKFGLNFGQLRKLIAHISGTKQDIVERKMAMQTAISPAQAYLI